MNPASLARRLTRITSSGDYVPEVDGLRFIAISSVLLAHVATALHGVASKDGAPALGSAEQAAVDFVYRGTWGVELFFVISGFILALPFARYHLQGASAPSMGRYYVRRLTRLEPPYIACLCGFFAAAWLLGENDLPWPASVHSFLWRLLYAHSIVYGQTPTLNGVTWTLEIEVQFYLLVPLLVQVFRVPALVRALLILAAMAILPWIDWPSPAHLSILAFGHYFLAGFLLAEMYLISTAADSAPSRTYDLLGLAMVVCSAVLPSSHTERPRSLVFIILLFCLCAFRGTLLRRALCLRWICVIGGMCYSIYLLHYPLLVFLSRGLGRPALQLGFLPALGILAAVAVPIVLVVAALYFVGLERPCMDRHWPSKLLARILSKDGRRRVPRIEAAARARSPGPAPPDVL